MTVKLAAKLPKDYAENGLDKGEAGFLAHPFDQVVIVAYVDVEKITTDYDKATKEPTVKLAAVEIIADDEHLAAVRAAFMAAHDRRVNVAPKLPVEPEPDSVVTPSTAWMSSWFPELQLTDGVDPEATLKQGADLDIVDAEIVEDTGPLCRCGHPQDDHDIDSLECCIADADGVLSCDCELFVRAGAES